TFRNLGGKVADVTGTTNSGFTGNDAYDLSKGGIYMDSCGDKPTLKPCNNYITNNYFSRFNMASKTYTPAVSLKSGTVGARVANNVIHDGPHSGLLIAGVNNVYANNELYDLCSESDDAGAIYGGRNWTDANLTFTNNLLHDINGMAGKNSAYGIYFDDNMGSENVTGNIFYNVRTPVFGHGSWGNLIDGNVFANCGTPVSIVNYNWNQSNQDGMVASYDAIGKDNPAWNAAFPWWSKIGGAIDALSPRGVGQSAYLNSARDNVVTNNVSYASGAFNIASSALPTITMQNNVILPDAGYFTDAAANDYSLARIPSGLGADFVSPDYGAVGMYTDEYRSKVFVMNDFNLDYPFDGAANVQAYRLNLMWDRAVGATYYNVTVATDPGMSNVVFRGTAKGSFIEADGLDYGGKTYYWKVEAIGTSAKNPITKPDGNGVFSFTTAMSETADTSLLAAQISVGENYLNGVLVGVNPGEYTQAAYDVFAQTIADAKALMTLPGIVQAQADAMVQALKDGMKTLEASRITGLVDLRTLMRNASDWKTSSGAQFGLVPGESIAFKGSHLGYEAAVLPNYAIWSFRMQLGQPGDSWGGSWFAISLRNSNTIGDPWGATDYLFGFKQDVFELQKFGGASSLGNYQVPNNGIFELGKLYDIQYGVLDTPTGTHIIVKVDGRTIYDYYDNYNETANSNIPASGYIGFHFYGGLNRLQLQLYGAPEVQTDKSALEAGLTEAKGIIDGQAGKYTADSLAALESAIGAAQAVYDDSGADQSAVDEQAALLRQAIAGLAEAKLTCDVKSMLAKIAKPQKIPYTWTGVGMPAFTSSNAAVCGVTPDGTLTPLKAGIAVITITALNGEKVVFAVTVTA
ncbi:MAG: right-handed parallel beta-helix repeat-containing protein, partial [Firmicutes bacterium]|nr:right-handed parallel beta-helix repeat-containing protein [Bacillota bacterium]